MRMDTTDARARDLLPIEKPELMIKTAESFIQLMTQYKGAMMEIETKLRILDDEFAIQHDRNPIESIKSRLKTPKSIIDKLRRKGFEPTLENMENQLSDIAGIRVICSFPDDIYSVAELLAGQDDITLLAKKDYIQCPKDNGYRSLHLILGVPVFLASGKKLIPVEAQFRTIAMDFWASLEHKLKYKQEIQNDAAIVGDLRACADIITQIDNRMQGIRERIDAAGGKAYSDS